MQLIDTHSHLYADQFKDDLPATIERAKKNGLYKIYLPNIDLKSIEPMKKLVKNDPDFFLPMMGLHPCSVGADVKSVLSKIKEELNNGTYVAVGEIGIDLYWDKTFLKEQQWAFRTQIKWAKDLGLPIVIHARDSFDEIFTIVDELNDEKLFGIFHCFTGNKAQAEKIISYGGFKMGVGGVVTFKNAGLDKVLQEVDLKHLVLETDAPYLSPMPYRGKRNESAYVSIIAQKLADINELPLEIIAEITTANALTVYTKR